MRLVAPVMFLDCLWIEMLLKVCPVCSMLTFFQNRLCSQLPAVTGNGFFSPCIVDGMLSFVGVCGGRCALACLGGASV